MFTLEQIKLAHSKVKSGADFPAYIQDIKNLGVVSYETFVTNGNSNFQGVHHFEVSSGARYDTLEVAEKSDAAHFKSDLKAHQEGKTDFPTFCMQCATSGIEKWVISLGKMTCTYYDMAGNEILVEQIPD